MDEERWALVKESLEAEGGLQLKNVEVESFMRARGFGCVVGAARVLTEVKDLRDGQSVVVYLPPVARRLGHFFMITMQTPPAVQARKPQTLVSYAGGKVSVPKREVEPPVLVQRKSGTGCTMCARAVEQKLVARPSRDNHCTFIDFVSKWGSSESARVAKANHLKSSFHNRCVEALRGAAAGSAVESVESVVSDVVVCFCPLFAAVVAAFATTESLKGLKELDISDVPMLNLHISMYVGLHGSQSHLQLVRQVETGRIQGVQLPLKYQTRAHVAVCGYGLQHSERNSL
eukprot:Hpha_TRINITY_DN14204_c0_g1::TRINITY_DN14204_c0_g1_i1::g.22829::m.22829